jgi:hypothetical protein
MENRGELLNQIKGVYKNPNIFNVERLNMFSVKSRNSTHSLDTSIQHFIVGSRKHN